MRIVGFRSKLGKSIIGDAISTFESVSKKLEEGIAHYQADMNQHQMVISESQEKIRELGTHVDRANRVVAKLKDFVA